MQNAVSLRHATADDCAFIHHVYMDETINHFMNYEITPFESFGAIFSDLINQYRLWIILYDDTPCGIIAADRGKGRKQHVATINSFGILSEFRGRGAGRSALRQVVDALIADGFHRIELFAEEDNVNALAFYERAGFRLEAKIPSRMKRAYEDDYITDCLFAILP